MNWLNKFWKKLTAPPNPARVLMPRSAISPGAPIKQPGADFSKFTSRAQKVIELARREADRLNHNFVGTEHLLLGLAVLGQGTAVNVLTQFGINLETLRAEAEKQVGKGPEQEKAGVIPLTPRVKKVLALADKERVGMNQSYLGTEHILLGMLREGDGVAARILKHLGLELEMTRQEILKELTPEFGPQASDSPEQSAASKEPVSFGGFFFTPRARQALAFARDEAARCHHNSIGTEDLLIGLIRLDQGIAANVLKELGLAVEIARAQIAKRIDTSTKDATGGELEYTPALKRVLAQAGKETKSLDYTYIGIEALLLAILSEPDGIPAAIFKELNIDDEKMREMILMESAGAQLTSPAAIAARQSEAPLSNFTPRAQEVLALACKEADRFNHNFVGTEHVLLGLVALGEGTAVNVLARFGINLEKVRAEIEKQVGKGPDQKMIGNIPYTPRVKKMLALATKEAKALYHAYVGTEHILLGLLREGDGVAARVLKNLGLDPEKTREEILKELNPGEPTSSGGIAARASWNPGEVPNFSPRAQQALAFARKEADRLNHNFVGTEHLLLGIMKVEGCTAMIVLRKMDVVLDTVRIEIEKQIGTGLDQKVIGNIPNIPYTPRVKKVLALAAKEAMALHHTYVGTEHILLGLLREGDGVAARVLASFNVNPDDTRKEILKELDPNTHLTASTSMSTPNLPEPVDTTVRYDVVCREQPDKLVVYRNVLFKSVRGLFPRAGASTILEYAELEEPDGKCVFVAKSTIVRFSPQGATFEAEDI